jgi:hypothetical protein
MQIIACPCSYLLMAQSTITAVHNTNSTVTLSFLSFCFELERSNLGRPHSLTERGHLAHVQPKMSACHAQ